MKRIKAVVVLAAASAIITLGLAGCKHHGHRGPRGSSSAWADGGHPHFHGDGGHHRGK